jgi:hypothetical protein
MKTADPTIFRFIVTHPTGRVVEETTAGYPMVRWASGEIRRRYRDERGFTPYIQIIDSTGRDVTAVWDR